MNSAVWVYWEGPLPPYIGLCIRTISAHHDDVRVLDRQGFDRLQRGDRDLDLDALAVNHRSDFIRAYLLVHHGGLYVDADCIVLRELSLFFEGAEAAGFAGYRQAEGYMSCNLMAAVAGGDVITDHYTRVRAAVRAGKRLEWLDLASVPMDAAVASHPGACRLIPHQEVMPVWWGHSDELFRRRTDEEHAAAWNPQAVCYMLSNNTIKSGAFTRALCYVPESVLLRDRSFVSFLFRRALDLPPINDPIRPPEHLGGHEDVTQLDEGAFDYLVGRFGVKTMVDVGCGPGGMVYYARCQGIHSVGIDGDSSVVNAGDGFIEHDYTTGPLDAGSFDLGWAVEFVEHVEERFMENYLATLKGCRHVFITAAVPGQPGYHHVNCREPEYWIQRFWEAGFVLDREATDEVRRRSTMWSRFTQNSGLVFTRADVANPAAEGEVA